MNNKERVFAMPFAQIYLLYCQKVERKGRTKEEVDIVIKWLLGYNSKELEQAIKQKIDLKSFITQAPQIHPNAQLISGSICGYKIQEIQDPLMKKVRWLDKLVDELAKGKAMEKILRKATSKS